MGHLLGHDQGKWRLGATDRQPIGRLHSDAASGYWFAAHLAEGVNRRQKGRVVVETERVDEPATGGAKEASGVRFVHDDTCPMHGGRFTDGHLERECVIHFVRTPEYIGELCTNLMIARNECVGETNVWTSGNSRSQWAPASGWP